MSALATVYSEMARSALVDEALRLRDERKELLAALIEVVRWDEISGIDAEWPVVMETVRAAVAKAKGE